MNFLKDFGIGIAAVAAVVLVSQGIMYLPTLFGFTKEIGDYLFLGIMCVYFTWIFGGLTRSIYFKEKS